MYLLAVFPPISIKITPFFFKSRRYRLEFLVSLEVSGSKHHLEIMALRVLVAVNNVVAFDRFHKFVKGNMESSIKKTKWL